VYLHIKLTAECFLKSARRFIEADQEKGRGVCGVAFVEAGVVFCSAFEILAGRRRASSSVQ
jgi:hypothetical protein